jgi:hypothetical protein
MWQFIKLFMCIILKTYMMQLKVKVDNCLSRHVVSSRKTLQINLKVNYIYNVFGSLRGLGGKGRGEERLWEWE